MDHITRTQRVGVQQRLQAGHRSNRALAAVGVIAHRRGKEISNRRIVVDVVVMSGIGDLEGLVRHALRLQSVVGFDSDQVLASWRKICGNGPRIIAPAVLVHAQSGCQRHPIGTTIAG